MRDNDQRPTRGHPVRPRRAPGAPREDGRPPRREQRHPRDDDLGATRQPPARAEAAPDEARPAAAAPEVREASPQPAPEGRGVRRGRGPRPVRSPRTEGDYAGYEDAAIPTFEGPIVPAQQLGGRALIAVVAIMTFLATLTIGVVTVVRAAADEWRSEIAAEMTVQLKEVPGIAPAQQLEAAVAALAPLPGIGAVRAMSTRDTNALLEPWLGSGVDISVLPVPRLVLVDIDDPDALDLTRIRAAVDEIQGASLDDHRLWSDQLGAAARVVTLGGLALLGLIVAALVVSVVFATRAAMAGNAQTVEVLHFCGASGGFIARQFERRFLALGLVGGAIGAGLAMVGFASLAVVGRLDGDGAGDAALLIGGRDVGPLGYAAGAVLALAVAVIAAATTRFAVRAYLNQLD